MKNQSLQVIEFIYVYICVYNINYECLMFKETKNVYLRSNNNELSKITNQVVKQRVYRKASISEMKILSDSLNRSLDRVEKRINHEQN